MYKFILLLSLLVVLAIGLWAQPETVSSVANTPPPQGDVNLPPVNNEIVPAKSLQEVWLSVGVLAFGIIVVLAQTALMYRRDDSISESFKYLSVTLIIVGALFLVTAGYGNSQIAPIIGLLGTVAGYLLGRAQGDVKKV